MKKIIAFTGSNSSQSINRILLDYASSLVSNVEVKKIDLREFDIPMYGIDLENETGMPDDLIKLVEMLSSANAYIISSPEHNGLMPAFFKNILDWLSRAGVKYFGEGKILILGTSPGRGGAQKAITVLERILPYGGGKVMGTFSLPLFKENMIDGKIVNADLDTELKSLLNKLQSQD